MCTPAHTLIRGSSKRTCARCRAPEFAPQPRWQHTQARDAGLARPPHCGAVGVRPYLGGRAERGGGGCKRGWASDRPRAHARVRVDGCGAVIEVPLTEAPFGISALWHAALWQQRHAFVIVHSGGEGHGYTRRTDPQTHGLSVSHLGQAQEACEAQPPRRQVAAGGQAVKNKQRPHRARAGAT